MESIDINDLPMTSEDIDTASADFFQPEGYAPIKPGRYISRSRTLEGGKTQKGKPCIKVKFEKFTTLKGEEVRDFPPFETLYFHKLPAWQGVGEISSVGLYLKACGLPYKGLSEDELKANLKASANIAIVVKVGWEQDYKEVEEGQKKKRTGFFKNSDGTFTHQKVEDGKVVTARAKVEGYEALKG